MPPIETPDSIEDFPLAIISNMISLATSGFGLVVALAWNELIKSTISEYLEPLLGSKGGLASLFVYALAVTVLAVLVTMQLSKIERRLKKAGKKAKEEQSNE